LPAITVTPSNNGGLMPGQSILDDLLSPTSLSQNPNLLQQENAAQTTFSNGSDLSGGSVGGLSQVPVQTTAVPENSFSIQPINYPSTSSFTPLTSNETVASDFTDLSQGSSPVAIGRGSMSLSDWQQQVNAISQNPANYGCSASTCVVLNTGNTAIVYNSSSAVPGTYVIQSNGTLATNIWSAVVGVDPQSEAATLEGGLPVSTPQGTMSFQPDPASAQVMGQALASDYNNASLTDRVSAYFTGTPGVSTSYVPSPTQPAEPDISATPPATPVEQPVSVSTISEQEYQQLCPNCVQATPQQESTQSSEQVAANTPTNGQAAPPGTSQPDQSPGSQSQPGSNPTANPTTNPTTQPAGSQPAQAQTPPASNPAATQPAGAPAANPGQAAPAGGTQQAQPTPGGATGGALNNIGGALSFVTGLLKGLTTPSSSASAPASTPAAQPLVYSATAPLAANPATEEGLLGPCQTTTAQVGTQQQQQPACGATTNLPTPQLVAALPLTTTATGNGTGGQAQQTSQNSNVPQTIIAGQTQTQTSDQAQASSNGNSTTNVTSSGSVKTQTSGSQPTSGQSGSNTPANPQGTQQGPTGSSNPSGTQQGGTGAPATTPGNSTSQPTTNPTTGSGTSQPTQSASNPQPSSSGTGGGVSYSNSTAPGSAATTCQTFVCFVGQSAKKALQWAANNLNPISPASAEPAQAPDIATLKLQLQNAVAQAQSAGIAAAQAQDLAHGKVAVQAVGNLVQTAKQVAANPQISPASRQQLQQAIPQTEALQAWMKSTLNNPIAMAQYYNILLPEGQRLAGLSTALGTVATQALTTATPQNAATNPQPAPAPATQLPLAIWPTPPQLQPAKAATVPTPAATTPTPAPAQTQPQPVVQAAAPAQTAPNIPGKFNPASGQQLANAVNTACKIVGCNAPLIQSAMGGVCAIESQCNSQAPHPGSQYQGFGQLGTAETYRSINELNQMAQSPNLSPAEQAQVRAAAAAATSMVASGVNPNSNPVVGPWLLTALHVALGTFPKVSAVTNNPYTAAAYLENAQLAPVTFSGAFSPSNVLSPAAVNAYNRQGWIPLSQGTTVAQAAQEMLGTRGQVIGGGVSFAGQFTPNSTPAPIPTSYAAACNYQGCASPTPSTQVAAARVAGVTALPNGTVAPAGSVSMTDSTTGASFSCSGNAATCVAAFQQQAALSRLCASNPATCNASVGTFNETPNGTAQQQAQPRKIIAIQSAYGAMGKLAQNPNVPTVTGISSQSLISQLRAAGVPVQDNSSASLSNYPHGKNQMAALTWHGDGSSGNGAGLVQEEITNNQRGASAAQAVLQQDGTLVVVAPLDAVSFHAATMNKLGPGIEIQGINNTGGNPTPAQLATMQKVTNVVMNQLGWEVGTHGQIEPSHKDALEAGPSTINYVYQGVAPGPVPSYTITDANGNPVLGANGQPITTTQAPGNVGGASLFLTNPDGTLQVDQNGNPIPVTPVTLTPSPTNPNLYTAPDNRPPQPFPANPWTPGTPANPYPYTSTAPVGQPAQYAQNAQQQPAYAQPPQQVVSQPITQPVSLPVLASSATSSPSLVPAALTLIANPKTVQPKGTSKISWSSVGTRSCDITAPGGIQIGTTTNGSVFSPELSTTTLFTALCITDASSTISATTSVEVQ